MERSAALGYPSALLKLSHIYMDDPEFKDLNQAAGHGSAFAVYFLCNLYKWGMSVKQDLAEAMNYFIRAADLGEVLAQLQVAKYYASGTGPVPKDQEKAVHYFSLAAEQNDAEGIYNLGMIYLHDSEKAYQPQQFYQYMEKAAELGRGEDQFEMAVHMLSKADKTNKLQDYLRSTHWMKLAAFNGSEQAKKHLAVLARSLAEKIKPTEPVNEDDYKFAEKFFNIDFLFEFT